LLASSSYDTTIRLWKNNEELSVLEGHKDRVFGLAWRDDGKVLASASGFKDGIVRQWSADGESLAVLEGHTSSVYRLKWKPSGNTLASASFDKTVRLWKDGSEYAVLKGHKGPVFGLNWSTDGRTITSAGMGQIGIWRIPQIG
jgi:WD40 repeat protein